MATSPDPPTRLWPRGSLTETQDSDRVILLPLAGRESGGTRRSDLTSRRLQRWLGKL